MQTTKSNPVPPASYLKFANRLFAEDKHVGYDDITEAARKAIIWARLDGADKDAITKYLDELLSVEQDETLNSIWNEYGGLTFVIGGAAGRKSFEALLQAFG